jgi:meso-butanediol dehydrogenase/(S,S)-butanediol dehydrogenase/diacetyl reductase
MSREARLSRATLVRYKVTAAGDGRRPTEHRRNIMRLEDQVAVVTGGGGGIGEGICLCLAREGAHVVVSDVQHGLAESVVEKVRGVGRKAVAVRTDVRRAGECQALIDTAVEELGRLDILVCGAGVMGYANRGDSDAPLSIENLLESDWDLAIDVNLKGVFLCCRAVTPYFKAQKRGKIVNIASVAARRGVEFLPHYAASKAGVVNLTQSLAMQMAAYGVNVNAVCPGIVWTPMWQEGVHVLGHGSRFFKGLEPQAIFDAVVRSEILFKRPQQPEDIGNAVVFFASDEAKEITGQSLNVCGGMRFN